MNNKIKRSICLCLILSILFSFVGCRKNPLDESYLSEEIVYVYRDASSNDEQSESTDVSSNISDVDDASSVDNTVTSSDNSSITQSEPEVSTIKAPTRAYLYKGGKKYILEDTELNLQIAKKLENGFANIDKILAASLLVLPDLVWDIKNYETAVELFYDDKILLNGKSLFGKNARSILIPITGEHNDLIFDGDGNGVYFPGPICSASNSSFNDIIKSVKIEALEETPSIRMTMPQNAFLYRDGKKYRLTDEEQVLNIAKEIELAFYWLELNNREPKIRTLDKSLDVSEVLNSFTNVNIGIEFYYGDQEILLNGKRVFNEDTKGFFVPVSTREKCYIFTCEEQGKYSKEYYSQYGGDIEHLIDSLQMELIK